MKDLSKKIEFDNLSQGILLLQQKLLNTNLGLSIVGESLEDSIRVEDTDDQELLDAEYKKREALLHKLEERYNGIQELLGKVKAVYPEFASNPFGNDRNEFEKQKVFADRYLTPRSKIENMINLLSVRQVSPDRDTVFYDEPIYNSKGELIKAYDLASAKIPKDDKVKKLGEMEDKIGLVIDSKSFNDACVFEYEFIRSEIINYVTACAEKGIEIDPEIYNLDSQGDSQDLYSYLGSKINNIYEYNNHNKGKRPVYTDYEVEKKNRKRREEDQER
jgi:hypothetical protein